MEVKVRKNGAKKERTRMESVWITFEKLLNAWKQCVLATTTYGAEDWWTTKNNIKTKNSLAKYKTYNKKREN